VASEGGCRGDSAELIAGGSDLAGDRGADWYAFGLGGPGAGGRRAAGSSAPRGPGAASCRHRHLYQGYLDEMVVIHPS
jgi:hypothetical protein